VLVNVQKHPVVQVLLVKFVCQVVLQPSKVSGTKDDFMFTTDTVKYNNNSRSGSTSVNSP